MMKKVLYGVALTLLASVSVGSLQSCKDDVNDLKTQTSYDLSALKDQLQNRMNTLQTDLETLKGRVGDNESKIAAIEADYAKLSYVNQRLTELETAYKNADSALQTTLENKINGAISQLNQDIDNKISGLNGQISGLDEKFATIETVQNLKEELEGKIGVNAAAIEALDKYVKETLKGEIDNEFEQVYLQLEEAKEMISQVLNTLQEQIGEVDEKVNDLIASVDSIIKSIVNQLDKKVTGILIQGVNSPVFGDFRTPLGIKSNILFNWYGYNAASPSKPVVFPSADVVPATLAHDTWSAPVGYYGDDADNNVTLGKVYVTVNPVGANFDNLELFIENSAGARLPYSVTLTPSDEVLYHGYTRGEENGFYEGEVKLPLTTNVAENEALLNEIKVTIEENLKTSMKDALKDPSKTTAKTLVKAVLEQLQGKIPAYGLRYDWTVGEVPSIEESMDPSFSVKSNAVLSQYDLAVATAHPLSYIFLADYPGSNKKLPEIGHINNLISKLVGNNLHFTFDKISFNNINIHLPEITISADEVEAPSANINVTIGEIKVYDNEGNQIGHGDAQNIKVTGVDKLTEDIAANINTTINQLKGSVAGWSEGADQQINDELQRELGKIATQINDMMDSINGQIDNMIANIENKFKPYYDKVNKAIDLYNKIANKINHFLADPNAYLQVAAFYSMGGSDYGMVSGKASDPTPFVNKGGDSFKLFLSSYTGELIVPACKKYVAVTGVYKRNGKTVTAVTNADLAALNTGDLNKVLSGNQIEVLVKALPAGNVYEFTYQAIDYSGYTSTKKFYIEVK